MPQKVVVYWVAGASKEERATLVAELEATIEQDAQESTGKRERSKISFPYGDLNEAITVVSAIHRNVGAGQCDLDQVAGWMHQSVSSGAFRTKVNAARIFGLVKTGQGKLSLTALGQKIVDPDTEPAARIEAFLTAPLYLSIFDLYKGITLPPNVGLERQMAELGVAAKQTDKARQTFQRSAEQAGFFREGNNKLVRPGLAPVDMDKNKDGGGDGGDGDGGMHPLVRGLVQTLPQAYTEWPDAEQTEWIEAAKAIFKLIYRRRPGKTTKAASPNAPEPPSEQSPTAAQD